MDLESHRRETELFARALDLELDEQRAFLEGECGSDVELAARVLALLARDRESASRFDRSALQALAPTSSGARMPEHIGPYRILGILGSGGMALVYRAEQYSPRREVALKVIRSGLANTELIRRFEKEAHVLARLDHPGIARVFDAGVFEGPSGPEPFVAMELVAGEPLLDHIDRIGLSRHERVELLARVCDAVAHAHDHGVVHRDLKPSNVLVKPDGQPKVLDFGVALIVGGEIHGFTRHTSDGELIGTLPYMSPEQLDGHPARVDERSDVYAVGVMTFEALTGRLPHDLTGVSVPAAARTVIESAAPRLGDVDRTLRGDLETIVGKALSKDHAQRYASIRELGEDLRRHLRHEPVRAVPPSQLYHLRRFARRNPALTTSLVVAALLLVTGTVVSTWQARRAERAQAHAERLRDLANDETRRARRESERAALSGARIAAEHHEFAASRRLLESVDPADRGWVWRWLRAGDDDRIGCFAAPHAIRAAAFLPDLETIVAVDAAGKLTRWSPDSGRTEAEIDLDAALTGPAAFDPEGRFLAGVHGGEHDRVSLWEAASGRRIADVACSGMQPNVIAVSSGGEFVACGGKGAFLWATNTVQPVAIPCPTPTGFAFASDGARLFVAYTHPKNGPGWLTTLDVATAKTIGANVRVVASDTLGVAVGSGESALVGCRNKRAYLVDARKRRVTGELTGDSGAVVSVALDCTGARAVTGSAYGSVRVWDTSDLRQLSVLGGSIAELQQVAFSADRSRILGVAGDELGVWEISAEPDVLRAHKSYVYDLAFIRGGARLVSLSYDGQLCVWDAASLELLRKVRCPGSEGRAYALAVARDGDLIAVAQPNGVSMIDGDSLLPLTAASFHVREPVRAVSLSPDGLMLAALTELRVVLFDVTSGAQRGEWSAFTGTPYGAVAFSQDGRRFAYSARSDVIVRDAADGKELARLNGHRGAVESLAFSPDDALLASGAVDRTVRVWETRAWSSKSVLDGHTDRVYALLFSPDGTMLASGSNDTTIRLWSVATDEEIALLTGHEDYVFALAFDPDGSRLASASGDRTVRLWDTLPRSERWRAGRREWALRDSARPRVTQLLSSVGDVESAVRSLRADATLTAQDREACVQALLQIAPGNER